ncbi:unnamed protein product [marine sediment metagenome]|uniref:Uncharacterized protein n=1 Tax=marine sediment metagenome TaxID=412755 RepID=X1CSK0_9ZZZZ
MFDFMKTPADDIRKWSKAMALIATKAEEYDYLKTLLDTGIKKLEKDPQYCVEVTIKIPKGVFFKLEERLKAAEINVKKAEEGL